MPEVLLVCERLSGQINGERIRLATQKLEDGCFVWLLCSQEPPIPIKTPGLQNSENLGLRTVQCPSHPRMGWPPPGRR